MAKQHGIKQDTVARWKKRAVVEDRATGPKDPSSTVLSVEEKTAAVAFYRQTANVGRFERLEPKPPFRPHQIILPLLVLPFADRQTHTPMAIN